MSGGFIPAYLPQKLGQESISFEDSTGKRCMLEVIRFLSFSIAYYKLDFITISFFVRSRANTVVTCPVPRVETFLRLSKVLLPQYTLLESFCLKAALGAKEIMRISCQIICFGRISPLERPEWLT
jgi:hypothetical protein